jgi:hypothetical protein
MSKQTIQIGGGNCVICGAPGVTKLTCPANPLAKNPNPAKHPNAQAIAQKIAAKPIAKVASTPVKLSDIYVGIIKIKVPDGSSIFDFTMISRDLASVKQSVQSWVKQYPDVLQEFFIVRTQQDKSFFTHGVANEPLAHRQVFKH